MRIVRPVETRDLDALVALADALGPGMTTLPVDRKALGERIDRSKASFAGSGDQDDALYLLVLEDGESGALLGTSALYPRVGSKFGFFSYKRLRLVQRSHSIGHAIEVDLLMPANDYTGTTEVGSLAVRPDLRGDGAGRLLARARYLLIACFPERFGDQIMAEMRGTQDEGGNSPFWDAVGARFFGMGFTAADHLSAIRGSDFISELLPKHPLYVDLLPPAARDVIGRPHASSAPAMAMLLNEGFAYEGFVDVFDAGPQVHARRDTIATVKRSRAVRATGKAASGEGADSLICSTRLPDFRVVAATARMVGENLLLGSAARHALQADQGASLRHVSDRED